MFLRVRAQEIAAAGTNGYAYMTQASLRERLRALLLDKPAPVGGDNSPSQRRRFPVAKAAGAAFLVLVLTALRKPVPLVVPQFWADDGPAFFVQALEFGPRTFLIAHGGYYHTFIRLVALGGRLLPVALAPHWYLLVSIAVLLFVAGYLFSPRLPLRYPTLMALCLGLVPHGGEVYFTLANVNFLFGLLLALLLVSDPPASRRQQAFDLLVIAVAAFSGPFSLILFPLYVFRAARERQAGLAWRAALVGAAAITQFTQVLNGRVAGKPLRLDAADVLAILGRRLLAPLLWGPFGAPEKDTLLGLALGVGAIALLAFLVWGLLPKAGRKPAQKSLYLLAAGLLVVVAALDVARDAPQTLYSVWSQDRFFFVPLVILMWCLVQLVGSSGAGWARYAAAALLCFSAARTIGQPCLPIFEMKDLHWAEQSRCIGGPVPCVIPINPPGWTVRYEPDTVK